MAMPSVIPLTPGVGEKMGESFGTGLSSGFQALANMKLQQMQQRHQQGQTAQALQSLFPNLSPEQAQSYALFGPQSLNILLKHQLESSRDQELMNLLYGQQQQQPMMQPKMQEQKPIVEAKPQKSPEQLRALADRIELIDPKRFKAKVLSLRQQARDMERTMNKKKKLTETARINFLMEAGGNIDKAKKLALDAGYED